MRRLLVLGATGSVGVQALQVVASACDMTVVGLSCRGNVDLLLEQASSFGVTDIAVADEAAAATVSPSLYPELRMRSGADAAARMVREVEADIVLNAIVGFAGLEASMAALEKTGGTLALANKESLVCAGESIISLAAQRGSALLPVDSEHSAIYQLVEAAGPNAVDSIVITASGGPFLGRERKTLQSVTVSEALAHPTWSMGRKISIDSATLMNKGLEIIEAHHLFGLPYEKIEVAVHPRSIVHGMVRMNDGALLAHLGVADMRVPISYALRYPQRGKLDLPSLDFGTAFSLEFRPPDDETFPALRLARQAGERGDRATCAFNAANEVAVESFLDERLSFLGISEVVESVVGQSDPGGFGTYSEVVDVDMWARRIAEAAVKNIGKRSGQ